MAKKKHKKKHEGKKGELKGAKKSSGPKAKKDKAKKPIVEKKPKRKGLAKAKSPRVSTVIDLSAFACPCCGKHCPLSKPKCGKGRAIAKKKQQSVA